MEAIQNCFEYLEELGGRLNVVHLDYIDGELVALGEISGLSLSILKARF